MDIYHEQDIEPPDPTAAPPDERDETLIRGYQASLPVPPRATTPLCAATNRDGYQCELQPGHRGTLHRALIGATDEQGAVPEVKWREIADGVVEPWSCDASCVGGGYPALCYMYPNETHAGCPRAPLAAHPATTPEPMTDREFIESIDSPYWRLRCAAPSRDSGALPDFTAMVRRVANSRTGFRESPAAAELLAAIAALAGSPSRESGALAAHRINAPVTYFPLMLDNLVEDAMAGRNTQPAREVVDRHLSTLERDAAQMREALTELVTAALEVNNRYIGGSPLKGRLGDAINGLATAQFRASRALTPSGEPTMTPRHCTHCQKPLAVAPNGALWCDTEGCSARNHAVFDLRAPTTETPDHG